MTQHPSLAPHGMKPDNRDAAPDLADEIAALRAENADLRASVIAFGGPWAVKYAYEAGYPTGHLHPAHYDVLARAGARMDDFVRHETGIAGETP